MRKRTGSLAMARYMVTVWTAGHASTVVIEAANMADTLRAVALEKRVDRAQNVEVTELLPAPETGT